MREGTIRLIWQCNKCKDVVLSYSTLRHDMNFCECGDSAVDLEEYYQRNIGDVKEISRKKLVDNKWTKL